MSGEDRDAGSAARTLPSADKAPDLPPASETSGKLEHSGDVPRFPRAFGNYLLVAPLAKGGMGEVFLARSNVHGDAGLQKRCVVKTLRPHLTDDREYTTRFIDEAHLVVQLSHKNICHVFDVGTVGERYYLAMEYIGGRDLRTLAMRCADGGNRLDTGVALYIVGEVLQALDYAHRQRDQATGEPLQLVHRDVSPQNIMVSFEGEVKLIDFGLAASTLKMEQTQPNVVMGKLAYMSPEQVRGEKVDGRADLFACAIVLYETLVGERFYDGKSPYEIWGIAAQGGFRPRRFDELLPGLRDILDTALAAKVKDRYATCAAFHDALLKLAFDERLRGDMGTLRALVESQLEAELKEDAALLQRAAALKLNDPLRDPLGDTSGGSHPSGALLRHSQEPTMSLARAPSGALVPSTSSRVQEHTRPTERHPASTVQKRSPLVAAVAALALIAVGGVVAARTGLFGATEATPAPTTPPAVVVTTAPPPAPAAPPFVIPPLNAPPVAPPAAVIAPAAPRVAAVKAQPKAVPTAVAAPPTPAAAAHFKDLTDRERLATISAACPALPCTAALQRDTAWASSTASIIARKQQMESCWVTCQLPR